MASGTGGMGRYRRESPGSAPRGRWDRLEGEIQAGNSNLPPTQKVFCPQRETIFQTKGSPSTGCCAGGTRGIPAEGPHKLQPGLQSETLSQETNKRGLRDSCTRLATPPDPHKGEGAHQVCVGLCSTEMLRHTSSPIHICSGTAVHYAVLPGLDSWCTPGSCRGPLSLCSPLSSPLPLPGLKV